MNKHKWHAIKSRNTFYAGRTIRVGKKHISIKMHRAVIHLPKHLFADHINRNGLDNRKANLRPATIAQNNFNKIQPKAKNATSKYQGVTWDKNRKMWLARIGIYGKRKHIGHFKDEIHAAKAYDKAAKEYQKEFAVLNFKE